MKMNKAIRKTLRREWMIYSGLAFVAGWCLAVALDVTWTRGIAFIAAAQAVAIMVQRLLNLRRRPAGDDGGTELPVPTLLLEVKQPKRDEWRA